MGEKGIKKSFGVAEFKIYCHVDKVEMIIHEHRVIAKTNKDIYLKLFNFCKKEILKEVE